MESLSGSSVGTYILRGRISRGGSAEVYRGQHREDGREVAVKVLLPERQSDKHHLQTFNDEYTLLSRLDHPGIPRVYRSDEIRGRACMVMDYVPGETLHALRAAGKPFDIASAFLQLVGIAAYLHEQRVVHNDLKLENAILRPDGRLVLVDFGNARSPMTTSIFRKLLARKERVVGTPTYMAPELVDGSNGPSFASDCYALGVCAHILFTGEPPFISASTSGKLRAAINEVPPSIRDKAPRLALAFAKLIDACLEKSRAARPADASVLHASLRAIAARPAATGNRASTTTPSPSSTPNAR